MKDPIKNAILKDRLLIEDGAATSHPPPSDTYARDVKRRFVEFIDLEFPELAEKVIRHRNHHADNVYVIDIAMLKKILVHHNAFPEGQGKNYGLLEWVMSNRDYLTLMML